MNIKMTSIGLLIAIMTLNTIWSCTPHGGSGPSASPAQETKADEPMNGQSTASPEMIEQTPETTTEVQPSGSGEAEMSGTTNGVTYPEKNWKPQKAHNKIELGQPSQKEQQSITLLGVSRDPRALIADYAEKQVRREGPPVLQTGQILFIDSDDLPVVFPEQLFYVLRFRQWPVAMQVPEPLGYNNIFVVDKSGKPLLVTGKEQLQKFFQQHAADVMGDARAKQVLGAWLSLSQEFVQDGMFVFSVPTSEMTVATSGNTLVASGKTVAAPNGGNSGELVATLNFENGKLSSVEETNNLQAGIRPICQSTKLLDADPIVRKMAEQDLLVMGRFAKPYLDEQRKKNSPALKDAIDRIWQKIQYEARY